MPNKQNLLGLTSSKSAKAKVPSTVKEQVATKANELIENVLKPRSVKPMPENYRFNYITNIYGKWYRSYFYFCSTYFCPGLNDISPTFEANFARLEYTGNNCFSMSFMRHTGQWVDLYADMSLDDCLTAIKDDTLFQID